MRRWFLSSGLTVPARSEVFEYGFQSWAIKVRFALGMTCRVSRDSDKEGSQKVSRRTKVTKGNVEDVEYSINSTSKVTDMGKA